jgi:tetratricopeptide (TPR) repeat protein
MVRHLSLLFRLVWDPAAAMIAVLDQGSLLFASLSVVAITLAERWPMGFYMPLFGLAIIYVPGILLVSRMLWGLGVNANFRRDYAPMLTCVAMAWTTANLPFLIARWLLPSAMAIAFVVSLAWFALLVFLAIRVVLGTGGPQTLAVYTLSLLPPLAAFYLWGTLQFLLGWVASPFFLFYAWYFLGGEIGSLGSGLRTRQNFRRNLEAATVNPHDAEAQYQLGLIAQERRQDSEAIGRFTNAVKINPAETDAHFQLGRIARRQGRLKDALAEFQIVLDQDEKHHQSEILRELGALYVEARQYADAAHELAIYVDRRPYDPEGLFHYGRALEGLGRFEEASEMYRRSVESASTAPRYIQRSVAQWSRLAQKQLRNLSNSRR